MNEHMARRDKAWSILLLLCGIFFIIIYFFLRSTDPEATSGLLVFLVFGLLSCCAAVLSMLKNHGAYFLIEENHIHAKYHWFGRLDCPLDDVAFVLPQVNTLTILLKNGKRHVITGVDDPWLLASRIRRHIFVPETESPIAIQQELEHVQAVRRKKLQWVIGCIALMFANILITVLLTGGKDLHAFEKTDWIIFTTMGFIECLTLIGLFRIAGKCGRLLLPIEQLKHRLCGAIIASQPQPSSNISKIYTDENYSGRIIVYGFPNDESVYYCVQEFTGTNELETVHTSDIYPNATHLPQEEFSALIDITPS